MTTRPTLEINVFGEFQLNRIAERAHLSVLVSAENAPITAFDIASITTSSRVPTDRDDNPTSLRQFSVFANLSATFRDFAKLGEIASQLFMMPFVEVRAVNWRLMDVTAEKLAKEARKKPLMDAIEKANDFAETGGSTSVSGPLHMARAMTARVDDPGSSGHSLDLEPQEITVRASIMAKFATADWKRPEGLRY
ncbi:hypothetical protein RJZ56_002735 [Blastomyces dermatitidis]